MKRMKNQLLRWMARRFPDAQFSQVSDPRRRQGRRWSLDTLLQGCVAGLLSGCQHLWQLELLTESLSRGGKSALGVSRRIPDTTLRDVVCRLEPTCLRACLHRIVKAAWRRKALTPVGLPFHVVAMDGKGTALPVWDDRYTQRVIHEKTRRAFGHLRTLTCALVTARGCPCIDAIPIEAQTNEMGMFDKALSELLRVYGSWFRVISYDAGAASEANAAAVVAAGKDYLFRLKDERRLMQRLARDLFASHEAEAETRDWRDNQTCIVRRVYLAKLHDHSFRTESLVWKHARTFVKVETLRVGDGTCEVIDERFYVSSLHRDELTAAQWLGMVRMHWGVENNNHHTLDTAFGEDEHPWITWSSRGALAVLLLRRIAYTLLALLRGVTLRSEENRTRRWRELQRRLYHALLAGQLEPIQESAAFL